MDLGRRMTDDSKAHPKDNNARLGCNESYCWNTLTMTRLVNSFYSIRDIFLVVPFFFFFFILK